MCGIAGFVALPGKRAVDLDVLRGMCNAIRHRGPDDEGLFHNGHAALGMRRLAIIDPSGGQQPLHSEDGLVTVVGNGEIYNYKDLRRRLEQRGHHFSTGSDIECVVHAYEEFGTDCFRELRGMFALAIWDEHRHRLVLARDRFGKKPLFHFMNGEGIGFASEMKSFLGIPGFDRSMDMDSVAAYMLYGYVPTPGSIFRNVRKLPPGSWLSFEAGVTHIEPYWTMDHAPKLEFHDGQLEDMLDDRLHGAVSSRLVSDVPFGAFLSGGIDSSLVVALMTRHLEHPVKTFSIGFDDPALDESSDAALVARHLGTEHHSLRATPAIREYIEPLVWHLDEPLADSSALPTWMVSQLASGYVKMVLSGDGGDELFAGYDRYRRLQQVRWLRRMGAHRLMPLAALADHWLPGTLRQRLSRLRRRFGDSPPDDYISGVALLHPAELSALLQEQVLQKGYSHIHRHFETGEATGELDRILLGDMRSYLLDDVLVKVDRMSMAHSLEVRAPLLDHLLAEFVARLPEHYKLRRANGKYLLRKVAQRYLPPAILKKPKQGFAVPLSRWMRDDLRDLLFDTLHSQAFSERGIFNVPHIRKLAQLHASGDADHAETLWSVLVLELWSQQFVDGLPLAAATARSWLNRPPDETATHRIGRALH